MAGFKGYGVDIFEKYNRKRCPLPTAKMDAIECMDKLLAGEKIQFSHWDEEAKAYVDDELLGLEDFTLLTASPPCQAFSVATSSIRSTKEGKKKYPDFVSKTRERFIASGLPYVIENVVGAPLLKDKTVILCGSQFDMTAVDLDGTLLHLRRHRQFESNVPLSIPKPCDHSRDKLVGGVYGAAPKTREAAKQRGGGMVPHKSVQASLMGIDWMPEAALHQAIPVKYTEHLGKQLIKHLKKNSRTA